MGGSEVSSFQGLEGPWKSLAFEGVGSRDGGFTAEDLGRGVLRFTPCRTPAPATLKYGADKLNQD